MGCGGVGRRQVDPSQSCWGLRDSGSDISAYLITLALNPVAGMNLNAHHPPAFGRGDGAVRPRPLAGGRNSMEQACRLVFYRALTTGQTLPAVI